MTDSNSASIGDKQVVTMHYTLKLEDGEIVDSSEGRQPMAYLHGAANIVTGLEDAITGKAVGDKIEVVVPAEQGYGPIMEGTAHDVPMSELPADINAVEGMPISAEAEDGTQVMLFVTEVRDDSITVDMNHPLAGEALHFSVEIVDVRHATKEELAHGHPHGPGGHDHH